MNTETMRKRFASARKKTSRAIRLLAAVAAVGVATQACSPAAPVATATQTPVPATATATVKPTSTPRPTATPNLAATQEMEQAKANIQRYVDEGYLDSTQGNLYPLVEFYREMAKMNYFEYQFTGYADTVQDFAAWGDIAWSSAAPVSYPDFSGCGFGFRLRDNGDGYVITLTNERIAFLSCNRAMWGGRCPLLGKTRGTGTVKFDNPAQAHFELIVSGDHATVLVDEEFIGEYSLYQDRLTEPGYFLYSIISGTNKDYGTRCEVKNANLWVPAP